MKIHVIECTYIDFAKLKIYFDITWIFFCNISATIGVAVLLIDPNIMHENVSKLSSLKNVYCCR